MAFGQFFLKIGKNQDVFLAWSRFVQIFYGLQDSAGYVGIAAAVNFGHKVVYFFLKSALLSIGHGGSRVKSHFGDDVLLAETARIDPTYRKGVTRLQRAKQIIDNRFGLV